MESGADHTLASYLAAARQQAGAPSLRMIAARTDYSHTTVGKAMGADPSSLGWPIIEQVAAALGANTSTAQQLWLVESAQGSADPEPAPSRHPHARTLGVYAWCATLLTGGIVIAMVQSVDRNIAHTTFVTDLVQLVFSAGTGVAFIRHAHRAARRDDRRSVVFFASLAAGALAWSTGQALWFLARNVEDQPIPTGHLHDVGFLLMPVGMGIALWMRAGSAGLAEVSRPSQRMFSIACVLGGSYATTLMIMTLLHLHITGFELLAALYPATDLTLALLAATPMVFGQRLVGSIILSTAFLAAGASDMAYLLLKANPETQIMPAQAGLGFIGFASMLSLYAAVVRPLPADPRRRGRQRVGDVAPRMIFDAVTAVGAVATAVCSALVLWNRPSTAVGIAAFAVAVAVAVATAARMGLNSISTPVRGGSPSRAPAA